MPWPGSLADLWPYVGLGGLGGSVCTRYGTVVAKRSELYFPHPPHSSDRGWFAPLKYRGFIQFLCRCVFPSIYET